MKAPIKLTAIAMGTSLVAASALAATTMGPPEQDNQRAHPLLEHKSTNSSSATSYSALDANADGKISKKEAAKDPELRKNWKTADVDKDNQIDRGEFARFEAQKMSPKDQHK